MSTVRYLIEQVDPLASFTRLKQAGVILSLDFEPSAFDTISFRVRAAGLHAYPEVAAAQEHIALDHLRVDSEARVGFLYYINGACVEQVTILQIERVSFPLECI